MPSREHSPTTKPNAVDVFSGAGGMTLGLQLAGFDVQCAIELDDLAVETYKRNHPTVEVFHRDVTDVTGDEILETLHARRGELDLLAGCPPCQGFSSLRTLNGRRKVSDSRNILVFQFLRLVRELKPKSILFENVPGMREEVVFAEFRHCLQSEGYFVSEGVLNAADYLVPQRRRRLILLASRFTFVEFPSESDKRRTVRDAIQSLPPAGSSGDLLHDISERRSERIKHLISKIPKDGGSRTDLGEDEQLKCHKRLDGFKDVYGRMAWDEVSPTLTAGCINPSKGRFLHPIENRAITLREAALLQTFPADYKFPLSRGKYSVASLIGNALPPKFAEQQARQIRKCLCANA